MKHVLQNKSGFSLVELLVVITILAIISTVAYTSFSGATDKAKNSKRLESLASIETALQSFKQEKQYLPLPATYSATTNVWGYNSTVAAAITSTAVVAKTGDTITGFTSGLGGGQVMDTLTVTNQVGAKGVMDSSVLPKEYLSTDLLDPGVSTIKVGSDKTLGDFGVGRYIYAVYAKSAVPASWNTTGKLGTAFNLATTILDEQKGAIAKISGDFDNNYSGCTANCPVSLIGPGGATANLTDGSTTTPYSLTY